MSAASMHLVRFEPNGVTAPCAEDECIGKAARRGGLKLFMGCENGGCGICKVHVIGPVHKGPVSKNRLTDDERATGWVLACRVYPRGPVEVRRPADAPFDPYVF